MYKEEKFRSNPQHFKTDLFVMHFCPGTMTTHAEAINITNFADDTIPYEIDKSVEALIEKITDDVTVLNMWFENNYTKSNDDKCKLIITKENAPSVRIGNDIITCSNTVKLLGITIDNKLNFKEHLTNICK